MIKREVELFNPSTTLEVQFLRNLIEEFLEILDSKVLPPNQGINGEDQILDANRIEHVDDACVLYCERFVEFLIDLLSQLPTRRYLRPLVADVAVVPKCHLSALYRHEKGKLLTQLVDLLQFYEGFEVNDHVGGQLTDDEVLKSHYNLSSCLLLKRFLSCNSLHWVTLVQLTIEMISPRNCLYFLLKN